MLLWARRLGGAAVVVAWVAWLVLGSHQWTRRLLYAARPGVTLEGRPVTGLLGCELEALVRAQAKEVEFPPRDAGRERVTGRLISHLAGRMVDVQATVAGVLEAPPGSQLTLAVSTVPPRYTTSDILALTHALGAYATLVTGSAERRENIRLAASLLNYTLLYPGQSFSFNVTIGPVTEGRGFRNAPVIIGEGLVPAVGVGICQAASTRFNAAASAGLSILERHSHSRPVSYVPLERDATVPSTTRTLGSATPAKARCSSAVGPAASGCGRGLGRAADGAVGPGRSPSMGTTAGQTCPGILQVVPAEPGSGAKQGDFLS